MDPRDIFLTQMYSPLDQAKKVYLQAQSKGMPYSTNGITYHIQVRESPDLINISNVIFRLTSIVQVAPGFLISWRTLEDVDIELPVTEMLLLLSRAQDYYNATIRALHRTKDQINEGNIQTAITTAYYNNLQQVINDN